MRGGVRGCASGRAAEDAMQHARVVHASIVCRPPCHARPAQSKVSCSSSSAPAMILVMDGGRDSAAEAETDATTHARLVSGAREYPVPSAPSHPAPPMPGILLQLFGAFHDILDAKRRSCRGAAKRRSRSALRGVWARTGTAVAVASRPSRRTLDVHRPCEQNRSERPTVVGSLVAQALMSEGGLRNCTHARMMLGPFSVI